MQGQLSKKSVLEKDEEEKIVTDEAPVLESDSRDDTVDLIEIVSDEMSIGDEEIIEEVTKKAEPKGNFMFLNLDEVDAYKEQAFANKQEELFEEKRKTGKPYRRKEKMAVAEKSTRLPA